MLVFFFFLYSIFCQEINKPDAETQQENKETPPKKRPSGRRGGKPSNKTEESNGKCHGGLCSKNNLDL